jgi:hypothetical protein
VTISFNLYAAGKRNAETLIGSASDFATALDIWNRSQSYPVPAWAIVPVGEADELATLGRLDSIAPGYYGGMYVTRSGPGCIGTLGYNYAASQSLKVAAWLEAEGAGTPETRAPLPGKGTPDAFAVYTALMAAGAAYSAQTGRRCNVDLVPELSGLEGKRVEVEDCDGTTRRFIVGKSSGWFPVHLEIARANSHGGESVTGAPFRSVREVR